MASATLVGVRRPDTEGVTLSMQNDPKRAEVDDRENYYPRLALIAGLIGIIVIVWAVNSSRASEPTAAPAAAPAAEPVTVRDGNPDVWWRIENGTDCGTLHAEWDTAMDNAEARQPLDRLRTLSLDYAAAASKRMRDLGCYG